MDDDFFDDFSSGDDSSDNTGVGALTGDDSTYTGTTNYQTDTGYDGSTGSVINSSANPVTTNSGPVDASGGNGSIPNVLQGIATQGLNDALVSAEEFGLGSLTDLLRVGAQGKTTAASAPSYATAVHTGGVPTWLIAVGAISILALVIHLTNKG
jgi:hypothetical protein